DPLPAEQPGQRERCELFAPPGRLIVRGQPMSAIAYVLTVLLDRVVQDHTGLTGGFDANAEFSAESAPGSASDAASTEQVALMSALQEQLGLKLESTRGPVDVLVIDSVQHPTED